ncbi:hypothetical protein OH77DRAFT_1330982 [Trametes cingulata]|nr:hypothetical protein OH77DRAFT_1330982 [Trametes cingulata]
MRGSRGKYSRTSAICCKSRRVRARWTRAAHTSSCEFGSISHGDRTLFVWLSDALPAAVLLPPPPVRAELCALISPPTSSGSLPSSWTSPPAQPWLGFSAGTIRDTPSRPQTRVWARASSPSMRGARAFPFPFDKRAAGSLPTSLLQDGRWMYQNKILKSRPTRGHAAQHAPQQRVLQRSSQGYRPRLMRTRQDNRHRQDRRSHQTPYAQR